MTWMPKITISFKIPAPPPGEAYVVKNYLLIHGLRKNEIQFKKNKLPIQDWIWVRICFRKPSSFIHSPFSGKMKYQISYSQKNPPG
jgi:hypothetical protein